MCASARSCACATAHSVKPHVVIRLWPRHNQVLNPAPPRLSGSDILIVDDSEANLAAYEAALAPLGRTLVLARSGMEALAQLLDRDFALVLLDGIETARMVRARPRNQGTPVLFISDASPSSELVLEAFEMGALDFITKPIFPELLRAKVSVHLRLRTAAELANKRKDEFLAMLGHELRNPLAAITAAVDVVRMCGVGLERETAILERQLSQLTRTLDDLLDASRITRGLITLRREAVELRDAVSQAIEMVQPDATRLGHVLVSHIPANVLVDADRNRFVQVVFNLLANAVKYTPAAGRIELHAEAGADFVTIVVRDNGRGIAPTLLSDMFELFVQGERGLDRQEGGLGIGLTLVRTLVQLHGGAIEVRSEGEGKGAEFTLRWPRASSRVRVLVVDDNVDAAEMLATVVESMGHVVEVAHHGEGAIALAKELEPDVVLLDVGLPGLDGYEVAAQLRALPSCAEAVVIAVTGYGAPEDVARSREAGFAAHIVKPPEPAMLRSVFERLTRDVDRG